MPTIAIKPLATIAQKWQTRAAAAGADYAAGVQNPRRPQAATAAAAAPQWAAAVAQAQGRFATRVAASQDKYTRNATGKGAQRYPGGVQAASGDYQQGIGPYLQVLSNLNLPARLPKGDPGNIQRVSAVDQALRAAKLAGG